MTIPAGMVTHQQRVARWRFAGIIRTWRDRSFRRRIGADTYVVWLNNGTNAGAVLVYVWPWRSEVLDTRTVPRYEVVTLYNRLRRPGGLEAYLMEQKL